MNVIRAGMAVPVLFFLLSCAHAPQSIHSAAERGQTIEVNNFIRSGTPVNSLDTGGYTALHYAASSGNVQTVLSLIQAGADVNRAAPDGTTPLLNAASYGYLEITEMLFNKGARVNVCHVSGETALLYAAGQYNVRMVRWLLEHGADVNAKNNTGATALHYAAQGYMPQSTEIARLLLSKNADITVRDNVGYTALRHALYLRNVGVVALIRKANGGLNLQVESLSLDEALRSAGRYVPNDDTYSVTLGEELRYKTAIYDCNLLVPAHKTGLLFATGPLGWAAGSLIDQARMPKAFPACMEKMGFKCVSGCSE